jgi:energy-coupling factor transporter transmembrane protein EcfT
LGLADTPTLVAFCFLGLVIGLFTGNSKSPVVASLLPVLVTFISGLVAYLAARDTLQAWRKQIPLLLVGFLATTVLSTFYGSYLRGKDQEHENNVRKQMLFYERVQLEYEKARLLLTLEPRDIKGTASTVAPPKHGTK